MTLAKAAAQWSGYAVLLITGAAIFVIGSAAALGVDYCDQRREEAGRVLRRALHLPPRRTMYGSGRTGSSWWQALMGMSLAIMTASGAAEAAQVHSSDDATSVAGVVSAAGALVLGACAAVVQRYTMRYDPGAASKLIA